MVSKKLPAVKGRRGRAAGEESGATGSTMGKKGKVAGGGGARRKSDRHTQRRAPLDNAVSDSTRLESTRPGLT